MRVFTLDEDFNVGRDNRTFDGNRITVPWIPVINAANDSQLVFQIFFLLFHLFQFIKLEANFLFTAT